MAISHSELFRHHYHLSRDSGALLYMVCDPCTSVTASNLHNLDGIPVFEPMNFSKQMNIVYYFGSIVATFDAVCVFIFQNYIPCINYLSVRKHLNLGNRSE